MLSAVTKGPHPQSQSEWLMMRRLMYMYDKKVILDIHVCITRILKQDKIFTISNLLLSPNSLRDVSFSGVLPDLMS